MSSSSGFGTRRGFLAAAAGAVALAGCGGAQQRWTWQDDETRRLAREGKELEIAKQGTRVLRLRARPVPSWLDLTEVAARMEASMSAAKGVGIAGPQVGLSLRMVTVMLGYRTETPHVLFARNPVIVERSDEIIKGYEGCLSVPGKGGMVSRNRWVKLEYEDIHGEPVVTEAEGPDAVLWQHELDHLDGVLYVDRLAGELLPIEEMRRRRKAEKDAQTQAGATTNWLYA